MTNDHISLLRKLKEIFFWVVEINKFWYHFIVYVINRN